MNRLTVLVATIVAFSGSTAWAQEDYVGARAIGMGTAGRASPIGTEAIYLNPAGMGLFKRYAVDGAFLYNQARETSIGNVSIIDAVTSSVAAGLSYTYVNGTREIQVPSLTGPSTQQHVDRTGNIAHMAVGLPFGKNVLVGVAGKYLSINYGDRAAVNALTVDAGMIYRISPMIALSVVGYGLTNTASAEAPLSMAVGFALGQPYKLQLAFDWIIDFTTAKYLEDAPFTCQDGVCAPRESATKHQFHVGVEWFPTQGFAIRAGYFHDRVTRLAPDNAITFGLGYFAAKSKIGFTAAFEQRFLNTSDRQFTFALNLFL